MKYMFKIIRLGYPLAIYPEGEQNWDGQTLPILRSTAKLIKFLNLPVVTVLSTGNYLACPRWANKRRKCPVTIQFAKPIIFDRKRTDAEIINVIQKAIDNNDNYTKIKQIRGRRPVDVLTRLLWRCPICRKIEGLAEARGKSLYCTQ
jgi:1-acyl-sn-glycerol-3-phosphate acyltransferase